MPDEESIEMAALRAQYAELEKRYHALLNRYTVIVAERGRLEQAYRALWREEHRILSPAIVLPPWKPRP